MANQKFLLGVTTTSLLLLQAILSSDAPAQQNGRDDLLLPVERLAGDGVWVAPEVKGAQGSRLRVTVWFDTQFLGDGEAYERRAKEFSTSLRRSLRKKVIATLRQVSDESYDAAKEALDRLIEKRLIRDFERHWIVNGFSCTTSLEGVQSLKKVPGVKMIFLGGAVRGFSDGKRSKTAKKPAKRQAFDPEQYLHPWYVYALQADRVWKEFNIHGMGTLNVVQDGNFVFSKHLIKNAYFNAGETPNNGLDDDGNGYVDDVHGFNFSENSNRLATIRVSMDKFNGRQMHGSMCANIICGTGNDDSPHEFGIAPESRWAGVIANGNLERAVEWAILQGADTYSMSFSIPGLGETRSHWRKIMEHGSFCGVCFVSGAGNFALNQPIPVQMRVPEDIPNAVFAAAGVRRDFSRTEFSSMGPVEWKTEHYQEGLVNKPEVCTFNADLPLQLPNGEVRENGLNGNSFAGPMFCGSIALMLSADPDLLPWDLREIITSTAIDVAEPGRDDATGHGLINCYDAVKEVLRRKAIRDGVDETPFVTREKDRMTKDQLMKFVGESRLVVDQVEPSSLADRLGIKVGDVIAKIGEAKILNVADFKAAYDKADGGQMQFELRRGAETVEVELGPGRMGVSLREVFSVPVFR